MKSKCALALVLLTLISGTNAFAAEKGALKKGNSKAANGAKLGTSFRFDGTTLRGKYQSSLGTSATVENDKYLDDLLGGRKNFSDRTQEENQRN